jgi:hypothetical protein
VIGEGARQALAGTPCDEEVTVRNHDSEVRGWEILTEDEAIDAAIEKYGKDPTTSVAYCAFEALDNRDGPEHRFWFDLFLKLA